MTSKNYYDILGVGQTASDDEIKKAYRKLAIKWHPDKHIKDTEAEKKIVEDRFKEINRAYEVLGDCDNKKKYDLSGHDLFDSDTDNQFQDADDVFNTFFKSFSSSFDGFDGMMNGFNGNINGTNGLNGMIGGINDMVNGLNGMNGKNRMNRMNGFKEFKFDGFNNNNVPGQKLTGRSVHINMNGTEKGKEKGVEGKKDPPVYNDLNVSLKELYTGVVKKLKITRNVNTGKGGVRQEPEILTIDVKPGWKEGTKITFNNKGDINPRSEPSDLIFVVKQRPDDTWERDDNDLITTVIINKKESRNGFSRTIKSIKEEDIIVDFKKKGIPDSNYIHTITGKGMPVRKEGKIIGYGDGLVRFKIE
jgi:DnaJ-class molecular chaperone